MKKYSLLFACAALVLSIICITGWLNRPGVGKEQAEAPKATAVVTQEPAEYTLLSSVNEETVTITAAEYARYQQMDELLTILDTVEMAYYKDVDTTKLLQGAASGMLKSLEDPYTFYYTPEAYQKLWEDDAGEYAGVGMQISINYVTGICTVSRVFAGSPALAAGLRKGDILYRLGNMLITSDNVDDAISQIRGTPGTSVAVTFLRDGEEITFEMERARIQTNWVDSCMLTDEIGYIMLYEFSGNCSAAFTEALNDLVSKGARGIVLDLRDNPGGWVDDAKNISDLFVDEGVLCYLEYRSGYQEYYHTTDGKTDVELVILVNENSASASEIMTGCLMERAGATVVGSQTYGKGVVQSVLEVGLDGAAMQLTIAQYFTPNGNAVHGIGITPDVKVAIPEGESTMYQLGDLSDPQLAVALQVMQEKITGALAAKAD